jgi:hypothetical protein
MGYTQELSVLNTLKNAIEIAYNENLSLDLTVFTLKQSGTDLLYRSS